MKMISVIFGKPGPILRYNILIQKSSEVSERTTSLGCDASWGAATEVHVDHKAGIQQSIVLRYEVYG